MLVVYLGNEEVFEGNRKEVDKYCKSHNWDLVLDKVMIEMEEMIANGCTFDCFLNHYDCI